MGVRHDATCLGHVLLGHVLIVLLLAWSLYGCGPRRVERVIPPALDPDAVAAAAIATADIDNDGLIERSEFPNLPALATALTDLDSDRNGGISKAELRNWFSAVRESEIALSQLTGVVMHRNKPLGNAVVILVPEACMGPHIARARAVTDVEGRFAATIPGSRYPGVHCGFYRVEISGTGNDGKPLAAPQGTAPPLGLAVGGMLPHGGFVRLSLDDASRE